MAATATAAAVAAPSLKRKAAPSADDDQDDQDHLDALDRLFKRIKTAVPRAPYVLSTPSLHPYNYHSRQEANAWMLGHLWRPAEVALQYRTFLYREPCQDCFELVAGEDDHHNDLAPSRPTPRLAAAAASQPAKRKPDLSAFKVKQAQPRPAPPKPAKPPPPAIKPVAASPPRQVTPHGLPPMLSPVQEPLGQPHGLPAILSPTLPPTIQAELDRLDVQRKRAESSASTSSSDRKSHTLAVPSAPRPLKPDGGPLKTENRVRSVSINGTAPTPAPVRTGVEPERTRTLLVKLNFSKAKALTVKNLLRLPPKKKPEHHHGSQASVAVEPPVIKRKQMPKTESSKKPESSIKNDRNAKNDGSTKTDGSTKLDSSTKPDSNTKPDINTKPDTHTKTATRIPEKRPRAEEDATLAVPSKRPRALSQQDRPITPVQALSSSVPSSKPSSTQKSQAHHLTPKKQAKGTSMLRTASSESHDATPGRSGATPGARADPKAGPTSAPLTGKKQADISLLAQTSMKLNQMGRALKHEATKILTAGGKIDKQDEKRAAVTNLECILSYMAAYYAQDLSLHLRNRPGEVEQTWKTLLPLCLSYARCTKDFAHLDGLRSYLSSIIASAICSHVAQRASNTRPHDSPHDMPHADLAKQHTSYAENFALLADHTLKMSRHFQDARIALSMADLQTSYKKTWAGRETNTRLLREPDKTSAATLLVGPYFLPLGVDTTPVQAVRFGLAFLSEYCEKEGIAYRLRVHLERPE